MHMTGASKVCWIAPGNDWKVGTAARYELRAFSQQPDEPVVPCAIIPAAASSIGVPIGGVTLIMGDDFLGKIVHGWARGQYPVSSR